MSISKEKVCELVNALQANQHTDCYERKTYFEIVDKLLEQNQPEQKANANIISTAPELLDALIKITDVVDAELHDVLPTHEYKAEVMQQARSIIEKALK